MIPSYQSGQGPRRRQLPGPTYVKHRRTRSGCFTCRQRRVKCDETHPICNRCSKGKRECIYPGKIPSSKLGKPDKLKRSPRNDVSSSSSGDDSHIEESFHASDVQRTPIPMSMLASAHRSRTRPRAMSKLSNPSHYYARRLSLPPGTEWYLQYYRNNMSHYHYGFKYDGDNFLKTTFLDIAVNDQNGALLNGILAFAAYHYSHATNNPGSLDYIRYHNQALNCLSQSVATRKYNVTTLLAILQLATFEEFSGDWASLLGHQKAAHEFLTNLFTPKNIMDNGTQRTIINWYLRFDLFAGVVTSNEANLGRDWFAACRDFYEEQVRQNPTDLGAQFEGYFATSRLFATDVTLLIVAKSNGVISPSDFGRRIKDLALKFANLGHKLNVAYKNPSCFAASFPYAPSPSQDDITDYRDPGFLYSGNLFPMNYVLIDFWAIDLMFRQQISIADGRPLPPELQEIALKQCKMFEAIQYSSDGPPGAIIGCQANVSLAAMFLPQDEKHITWCRRKLALIEQNGYIYPQLFRKRMSSLWRTDVTHWWLPNGEGHTRAVQAIREWKMHNSMNPSDTESDPLFDLSDFSQTVQLEELSGADMNSDHLDHRSAPSPIYDTNSQHF